MSLLPEVWTLSVAAFVLSLQSQGVDSVVSTRARPLDYAISTLLSMIMVGVQGHILSKLLRQGHINHRVLRRRRKTGNPILNPPCSIPTFFWVASVLLSVLFIVAATLICVNFCLRLWSVGLMPLKTVDAQQRVLKRTAGSVHCLPGDSERCAFLDARWGTVTRGLDLTLGVIVQLMIHSADTLLIYRCVVVFANKKWVWILAGIPFLASIVSTVLCIVTQVQYNFMNTVYLTIDGSASGHGITVTSIEHDNVIVGSIYPFASIISSVTLNLIVTTAIVSRILNTRRAMRKLHHDFQADIDSVSRGV